MKRTDRVRRTRLAAASPAPADWPPEARATVEALRRKVARLTAALVEAEGLADHDALTPVLNRRAFMREVGRAIAFARRYGASASLLYFDLDGFKAVNDRFGHAAGDEVLRTVARRLMVNVREFDSVGRLGGDEFGVVLLHADADQALAKARGLAAAVESEPILVGADQLEIKISFGVRALDPQGGAEQMLADADAAMFARKRGAA